MLKLILRVLEQDLDDHVTEIYRKSIPKRLFMTLTGYKEIKERIPLFGNVIEGEIKNLSQNERHLYGIQCTDEEAEEIASILWERLLEKYQSEEVELTTTTSNVATQTSAAAAETIEASE